MQIPVFVSRPTTLSPRQQRSLELVLSELEAQLLAPRSLGQGDYPAEFPLREVMSIARHCSGGVILGFSQFEALDGIRKKDTPDEHEEKAVHFPTPWNHLECGILYSLQLPLIVFREEGIHGGIFDHGVSDLFIQKMPRGDPAGQEHSSLRQVFLKWASKVREHDYREPTLL